MPAADAVFSFLGQLLAFGGGSAAVAYVIFQFLGKKWIENRFASRPEQLRHTQALEPQRLRIEIDSLLSGNMRLQEKEFQTLPEAWVKLDEAFGQVSSLVSPLQEYLDLDRMNTRQLEEFLSTTKLSESQKDEVRQGLKKSDKYRELRFWYRLNDVRKAIADLHAYIQRNSIFMPPDLKRQFESAADELWSAMVSKEVGHSVQDWKMQNEGWDKVKKDIEPLRKVIEEGIYARLQTHGKRNLLA